MSSISALGFENKILDLVDECLLILGKAKLTPDEARKTRTILGRVRGTCIRKMVMIPLLAILRMRKAQTPLERVESTITHLLETASKTGRPQLTPLNQLKALDLFQEEIVNWEAEVETVLAYLEMTPQEVAEQALLDVQQGVQRMKRMRAARQILANLPKHTKEVKD